MSSRALLFAVLELVLRRPTLAHYVDKRAGREFVERICRHATVVDDPVGAAGGDTRSLDKRSDRAGSK